MPSYHSLLQPSPYIIDTFAQPPAQRRASAAEKMVFLKTFVVPFVPDGDQLSVQAEQSAFKTFCIMLEFVGWIFVAVIPLLIPLAFARLGALWGGVYATAVVASMTVPSQHWHGFWGMCQYQSFLRYFSYRRMVELPLR